VEGYRLSQPRCPTEGETALALYAEELGGARCSVAGRVDRAFEERKEARKATPNQLVFPNGRGKPDSEMDMVVKRVAERAGPQLQSSA